jgi:hypothetical protein
MKKELSTAELSEMSNERSQELLSQMNRLSNWIDDAHFPSTGEYLESLLRSHLRRRLPDRFSVSTGFISSLERKNAETFERYVSRQFDIIVWDSTENPPLFENDEFAVVMPQSCYAVIEVTHSLTSAKIHQDLEKLDSLSEFYDARRYDFYPFTSLFAFTTKLADLESVAEKLHHHLYFNRSTPFVPVDTRYAWLRYWWEQRPFIGFPNMICALDKGVIYADESIRPRHFVKYQGARGESQIDAFGLFEKKLTLDVLQSYDPGRKYTDPDLYAEFLHASAEDKVFFFFIDDYLNDESIHEQPVGAVLEERGDGKHLVPEHSKTTSDGLRTGIWLEQRDGHYFYGKYFKGKRHGAWVEYDVVTQDGDFHGIEYGVVEYKNGKDVSAGKDLEDNETEID